jgi:hypothetical protein
MKMPHSPRGGRTLLLGIACLGFAGPVFAQNITPRGTLTVDNTLVRVGAQSQLKWRIQYPKNVADVVEITPTQISPKEDLQMRVRIVGAKVRTNKGHGNNIDGVDSSNTGSGGNKVDSNPTVDDEKNSLARDMAVEAVWSHNNSAWSRIYYGTLSSIIPTNVVLDTVVAKDDLLDFGARGFLTDWLPMQSTSNPSSNLLVLKNGDAAPKEISSKQYGQIEGFLKPYLSTDGKTVKIGALDLLILVELDESNPSAKGFDYQDLGMLVTFD